MIGIKREEGGKVPNMGKGFVARESIWLIGTGQRALWLEWNEEGKPEQSARGFRGEGDPKTGGTLCTC